MSKKRKFLLPILALISIGAVSCGNNNTSTTVKPSEQPVDSSTSDKTVVPVTTKYKVNIVLPDSVTFTCVDLDEDSCAEAGSTISFTLNETYSQYEITSVKLDDKTLVSNDDSYSFTMPNHEVSLIITHDLRGDFSLDVSDVDKDSLPEDSLSLKSYLALLNTSEAKYFTKGTISSTLNDMGNYYFSYDIEAGKNDVLLVTGNSLSMASSSNTTPYRQEIGRYNDKLYTLTSEINYSNAGTALTVQNIVSDETETLGDNDIHESEAKYSYSCPQVSSYLYNLFFKDSADYELTDTYESNTTKYYLYSIDSIISEDKKEVTLDMKMSYNFYSTVKMLNLRLTVDGNYFLKSADFSIYEYKDEKAIDENGHILDGYDFTDGGQYHATLTAGYKRNIEKSNIKDFAMNDYNVDIKYELEGESAYADSTNPEVYVGSSLDFRYMNNGNNFNYLTPAFKGVKEGDDYVVEETVSYSKKYVVKKSGEFTLLFDNGLGEIKEVKVNAIVPPVKSMKVTVGTKSLFINDTTTLTAVLTPSGANQEVNVTIKDGSTGEVSLSKTKSGSYEIVGKKVGSVTLVVTSVDNENISEEAVINVIEKPSYTDVRTNMLNKTYYGTNSDITSYINFNEDGTGSYVTKGYYSYNSEITFKWTLSESLEITISDISYTSDEELKTFTITGATTANAHYEKFSYYSGTSNYDLEVSAIDRVSDLSSLS